MKNNGIKMMKRIITIMFLGGILLLSACSSLGDNDNRGGLTLGGGGSSSGDGIKIDFLSKNIKATEGEEFDMYFNVLNFQDHEIDDLEIRPSGFDWGYVSGLENSYSMNLVKKTTAGESTKALKMERIILEGFNKNLNFDPIFKYCYTAKTSFSENLCIPDSFGNCPDKQESNQNHNGPLKVTVDEIQTLSDKIKIRMTVKNSLSGNLVNECFQSDYDIEYGSNQFNLNSIKLGSQDGDCRPSSGDEYVLSKNTAKIVCEFSKNQGDDSYNSEVIVDLEYKYQQEIKLKIQIRGDDDDN